MLALLTDSAVTETLGGIVGGAAPWAAGLFVMMAGIFGSNEKAVGAMPLFFLAALCCLGAFVFAPDTGFWTGVERFGWWGGGIFGALGAMLAFNQRGGNMRGMACVASVAGFAALAMYRPETTEVRLEQVREQITALEEQVDESIGHRIYEQRDALAAVQAELEDEGLSSTLRREREDEAHEIVRYIIALEQQREQSRETLSRLRSLERQLGRQDGVDELLGDDEWLAQFEEAQRDAGAQLDVELDNSLGSGAIADLIVQQRYQELIEE